jgi:DNA polymerase IV
MSVIPAHELGGAGNAAPEPESFWQRLSRAIDAYLADRTKKAIPAITLRRSRGRKRHVGLPGARTLSATHFCRRPFWRLPAARRCGHRRPQRFTPLVERISIDEAFADVAGCTHLFGSPAEIAGTIRRRVRSELGLPISIGVARTKHLAKIASQVAKPDGLVIVDPGTELSFLHDLPVELMWGVGPVTKERLAAIGVRTIGQLANTPGWSLEPLLGPAASEKLTALAWNRDPRQIRTQRRARSAGAQSALGRKPAAERVIVPTMRHLADRVASRLRAKSRPGRTVTVRVRFADLRSITRSTTLDAPIASTVTLAEIAEELVRKALAHHPDEKMISLLAISVSQLEKRVDLQLELPLTLDDDRRRPGSKRGVARWLADRAVDAIRDRFGWEAVGYGSVALAHLIHVGSDLH